MRATKDPAGHQPLFSRASRALINKTVDIADSACKYRPLQFLHTLVKKFYFKLKSRISQRRSAQASWKQSTKPTWIIQTPSY
jgi:hypothetical protein